MQIFHETIQILYEGGPREPTLSQKLFQAWLVGSDEEREELEREWEKMRQSNDAAKEAEPEPTVKP